MAACYFPYNRAVQVILVQLGRLAGPWTAPIQTTAKSDPRDSLALKKGKRHIMTRLI